ncbi:hypothetical protein [Pseudomonas aeruginosa]|nr:hypothetical protein [Pseudomonas aeruginosa]MDL4524079.1 hypothetical protein [Pseudomonas aeruginosa]
MIDWIAAMIELQFPHLSSGAVVCIEADGTVGGGNSAQDAGPSP